MNKLFVFFGIFISSLFIIVFPVMASETEDYSDDVIQLTERDYSDFLFTSGSYISVVPYNSRFTNPSAYPDDLFLVSGFFGIKYKDGTYSKIPVNARLSTYFARDDIDLFYINSSDQTPVVLATSSTTNVLERYDIFFYSFLFLLGVICLCRLSK